MDDWISSIKDKALQESLRRNVVVTGGCIASMLLQENVNDYDVYLKKPKTAFRVAKYYANLINKNEPNIKAQLRITLPKGMDFGRVIASMQKKYNTKNEDGVERVYANYAEDQPRITLDADIELTEHLFRNILRVEVYTKSTGISTEDQAPSEKEEKYRPVFLSSNAVTLSHKLQIVLRFTGAPEEIHKTYDFVHATNYWTFKDGLVTNTKALECILARELVYRGSVYPLASIFRSRKFIQRGWAMHIGNYVKMALQLNELDLFDPIVLEDQLTGVDMAYMHEVITAVKNKRKEDENFKFNATYLCAILDKLMGENDNEQ